MLRDIMTVLSTDKYKFYAFPEQILYACHVYVKIRLNLLLMLNARLHCSKNNFFLNKHLLSIFVASTQINIFFFAHAWCAISFKKCSSVLMFLSSKSKHSDDPI